MRFRSFTSVCIARFRPVGLRLCLRFCMRSCTRFVYAVEEPPGIGERLIGSVSMPSVSIPVIQLAGWLHPVTTNSNKRSKAVRSI